MRRPAAQTLHENMWGVRASRKFCRALRSNRGRGPFLHHRESLLSSLSSLLTALQNRRNCGKRVSNGRSTGKPLTKTKVQLERTILGGGRGGGANTGCWGRARLKHSQRRPQTSGDIGAPGSLSRPRSHPGSTGTMIVGRCRAPLGLPAHLVVPSAVREENNHRVKLAVRLTGG